MTMHSDVENPYHGGEVTVLLSSESADLESCLQALDAAGIQCSVDEYAFAGEAPLVRAAVPGSHKPSVDELESTKHVVVRALQDSNISPEIRGVGFQTSRSDSTRSAD